VAKEAGQRNKDLVDEERKCEVLKQQRDRLFKLFLSHPAEVQRAGEIKKIDDQVAECVEHLRTHH
jgi:hypothetical protein